MNLSASAPGYEPLGFVNSLHQRGSGGAEFFQLVGADFGADLLIQGDRCLTGFGDVCVTGSSYRRL